MRIGSRTPASTRPASVLAKEKCRNAHFWVLVARRRCPVRSGLDGAEHAAVAHHDPRRLSGCLLLVADGV
jgi:hypothetical protein